MFVVQAISTPEQYHLFQSLAAEGSLITKYPRMGRPAKKTFRISFVEGNIYFTWKGKLGNQGINLGEVNGVSIGITTDVLKRTASASKVDHFVSLICSERSVDLFLDTELERTQWKELLSLLVSKEHNELKNITLERPQIPNKQNSLNNGLNDNDLEWFILYGSVGERVVTNELRKHLLKLPLVT